MTTFNALGDRVSTAESNISANANAITQKVSTTDYNGNTIASLINQSATTVKIQASQINLTGAVTISSIDSSALATIQGYSTTAIDNIQIGGRNLVKNSATRLETNSYLIGYVNLTEDLVDNTVYTIRLWGSLADYQKIYVGQYSSSARICNAEKQSDGTYLATFTFIKNSAYPNDVRNALSLFNYPNSGNTDGYISKIKLEKGNKATDWTPAPEDVNANISNAQTAAQNYATTNCVQIGLSNAPDEIKNQVLAAAHGNFSYIDGSSIYTGTLNANQVTAGYISADRIAASSITAEKINVTDLTANSAFISNLKTNIVNAAYVNTLTLDAAAIKAGTIDTARMNASDIVTKGLQAKTIDAMNATIQNITVTNATISGTLNGCTGIFSGNLSGVKGTIGGWTIQDGGLYNTAAGTGYIDLEVSGGRFLRINNSSTSPVISVRADAQPGVSIYTQDDTGVGLDILAQTYATAIRSYGDCQFNLRWSSVSQHETFAVNGSSLLNANYSNGYVGMIKIKGFGVFERAVTSTQTLNWDDDIVLANSSSDITLTLPTTTEYTNHDGKVIFIRKTGSGNVTIAGDIMTTWSTHSSTSQTIRNGEMAMMIYNGNYWTFNYFGGA